jgi:dTDP-4-dehydrorhamnose 3,5-epimerase
VITALAVPGAWRIEPQVHGDDRGVFRELLDGAATTAVTGREFSLAQANTSVSRRGVIRGIHYAVSPPGQVKYVTCIEGQVMDVVVDLRSGAWDSVLLVPGSEGVLIQGPGHAWMALSPWATLLYLCAEPYDPAGERAVHPLDPAIGIRWPEGIRPVLSPRDDAAPSLKQAQGI